MEIFAGLTNYGHHAIHGHRLPLFYRYIQKGSFTVAFKVHGSLIGFYLSDDVTGFYLITLFHKPFHHNPFGHGIAHLGHSDDFSHSYCGKNKAKGLLCKRNNALSTKAASF
jgi:hypothetical protein